MGVSTGLSSSHRRFQVFATKSFEAFALFQPQWSNYAILLLQLFFDGWFMRRGWKILFQDFEVESARSVLCLEVS